MGFSDDDIKTTITLKGSVEIISGFFFTAINSILYQRGIYQPETFKRESKYGLTVLTTTDDGLLTYLNTVVSQMGAWLLDGNLQRLVVVVTGIDSEEVLERWQFNIICEEATKANAQEKRNPLSSRVSNSNGNENIMVYNNTCSKPQQQQKKSIKEIHNEIQAIIRQITASVTFLPLLDEPCSFDLLVYTNNDAIVPQKWQDSDPCYIMNSQDVKLRSFTTSVHKVDSMVTYKEKDPWEL